MVTSNWGLYFFYPCKVKTYLWHINFFFNGCLGLSILDGFWKRFFGYWWVEFNNIKFYKRTFILILDCFKPFYNGFGIAQLVHLCFFSDFIVNKLKIVLANYSFFRFGRVNKPTFKIFLTNYCVIFKSGKGFALVELFYCRVWPQLQWLLLLCWCC